MIPRCTRITRCWWRHRRAGGQKRKRSFARPASKAVPAGERKLPDVPRSTSAYSCTDFYVSNGPSAWPGHTIATLTSYTATAGVSRPASSATLACVPTPSRLYRQSTLVCAMTGQADWTTCIFDISDPVTAAYRGSSRRERPRPETVCDGDKEGPTLRVATSTIG